MFETECRLLWITEDFILPSLFKHKMRDNSLDVIVLKSLLCYMQ